MIVHPLMSFRLIPVLCLLLTAHSRAEERLTFNRDIRPILSDKCFACHGFDASHRKADLRLDTAEGAFAVIDGAPSIVPGDPAKSKVWQRIVTSDADDVMPPPESHKSLTDKEKAVIKQWIEQGAGYQKHWAFEPLAKPAAPESGNPVDAFMRRRLAEAKLAPAPEADRPTLIRRVSFALTGLPPTIAEVDAFLADSAEGAYERMVDRYLASPHFGEEMARHWLDVARYADTHGLHLDNERQMWAYRDWVVRAFNQNVKFDEFTLWQIAGDQLPNPTRDQLIATGFNRSNVTTSEGGAIAEEFVYRYAVDRASTVIQTWMGLTGGCAVCHDHKFDPLTMKEFYSFYAFFHSAADPGMDGNIDTTTPFLDLPDPKQETALAAAKKHEAAELAKLDAMAAALPYSEPASRQKVRDVIFDDAWPLGATARNTTRNATDWALDPEFGVHSGRRALHQRNAFYHDDAVTQMLAPVAIPAEGELEIWVRLDPHDPAKTLAVNLDTSGGRRRVWWGEASEAGRLDATKMEERRGDLPKPGEWAALRFTAKDLGLKADAVMTGFTLQEAGGVVWWDAFSVSGEPDPAKDPLSSFTAWWNAAKRDAGEVPGDLRPVFAAGPKPDVDAEVLKRLQAFYLARIARPVNSELVAQREAWSRARTEAEAVDAAIVGTFIFKDLDQPRDSFVMIRGQYDKPGEKVLPATPAFLPALAKSQERANRLDLAKWLVSSEHPLTARVTVNRFWQQFFGSGLVKTSNDFGSQGEVPSHPELLDWLSANFRDTGWDVKALTRLMLTSATFRQASPVTPALWQRDPENRLYARGPRFRLDAEQLRDNALFVSGLINLQMGGRGAMPYQPPNIWEPVGYGDSNTRYYLQEHGSNLYRRSLYTFLKRTAPAPFMSNFDAPNREQFCTRRERSNTPLQALQLMNDVQFFEAARAFAEQILTQGGDTAEKRIDFAYRRTLSRTPAPEEMGIVRQTLNQHLARYAKDPAAANKVIRNGESLPRTDLPPAELAAWTLVANLLMNLDETVTRN